MSLTGSVGSILGLSFSVFQYGDYVQLEDEMINSWIERFESLLVNQASEESCTEIALEKFLDKVTEKYKECIKNFNRALYLSIGFILIALYVYYLLPPNQPFQLPIIKLSVSRELWIHLIPLISYGFQLFVLTSLLWFLLTRLTLSNLLYTNKLQTEFTDVTNLFLSGSLSHLWIIFRLYALFQSKFHLVWYLPFILFASAIIISPIAVCVFFIVHIFLMNNWIIGILYTRRSSF